MYMKKRKPMSLIRLYKLANNWLMNSFDSSRNEIKTSVQFKTITEYLKYVAEHKEDNLD